MTLRLAFILALLLAAPARAQPTNVEAYQRLAVGCLGAVPDTARAFRLSAPAAMPYLQPALAARWQEEGRALFVGDTLAASLPYLHYEIEEARVSYAKAPEKHLARTVTLALRYAFTGADGRLLREDRCRETFTDTIRRDARAGLESEAFAETQGALPRGSWRRRYLEPAAIALATAVTVYLFFNLRSERSDDGI